MKNWKFWHWILLAAGVAGVIWLFRNWTKVPILNKAIETVAPTPDSFKRNDGQGWVTWEKINGEYFYTLDYGIAANIPQETTIEAFVKAYKA